MPDADACKGMTFDMDPGMLLIQVTLPETNSSPLKMMVSNRNLLFQGSIFRGYVSFREGSWLVVDTPSKV